MKKKSIFLIIICCTLLFLSSCKNDKNNNVGNTSNSNITTSLSIPEHFTSRKIYSIDSSSTFLENFSSHNGKTYIYSQDFEKSVLLNSITNENNRISIKGIDTSPNIAGEGDIIPVFRNGQSDNLYAIVKKRATSKIYMINKSSGEIINESMIENLTDTSIIRDDINGDIYVISDNNKDKVMTVYDNELNKLKEETIDLDLPGDNYIQIKDFQVTKNYICIVYRSINNNPHIRLINKSDFSDFADSELTALYGNGEKILTNNNDELYVCCTDLGTRAILINKIDTLTAQTTKLYEIPDANEIYNGINDFSVTLLKGEEIIGYNLETNEENVICTTSTDNFFICDNEIFSVSVETSQKHKITTLNSDFEVISQKEYELDDDIITGCSTIDNHGNTIIFAKNAQSDRFIIKINPQSDTYQINQLPVSYDIFDIATDSAGNLYMLGLNIEEDEENYKEKYSLVKLKNDYSIDSEISLEKYNLSNQQIFISSDDKIYLSLDNTLHEINFETNELTPKQKFPTITGGICNFDSTTGFDFMYIANKGVQLYSITQGTSHKLIDSMTNIDIQYYISGIHYINDYNFVISTSNVLYLVSEMKNVNHDTISVALDQTFDTSIEKYTREFNSTHTDVKVQLKNYNMTKTDSLIDDFSNDIISGNIPDIIISTSWLDISMLECKDMFEDLTPYLEKDPEINCDDYFLNIFSASSKEKIIDRIIPAFLVNTVIGKTSTVGEAMGWSYDEFYDFENDHKGKDIFYKGSSQRQINSEDFPFITLWDFIDIRNSKANFDDNFKRLLDTTYEYKFDVDIQEDKNDMSTAYESRFYDEKCLLDAQTISSVYQICSMRYAYIGEEITLKGFPAENSNGSYIRPYMQIFITKNCKNKEVAWEFVKMFLSEEYQDNIAMSCFPVLRSSMDKMINESQSNVVYIQGKQYNVYAPDKELKNQIINWIESLSAYNTNSISLINILDEQLQLFYNDEQSSEETKNAIQSRVNLYLSEIR